ncbi:MAG: VWA domain-containing protein [Planctomycetota bacterium]
MNTVSFFASIFLLIAAVVLAIYSRREGLFSVKNLLRLLAVLSLIAAFCGLNLFSTQKRRGIFIVDSSASYTRSLPEALTLIKKKIENAPPDSEAALITFGENASVEIPLTDSSLFKPEFPFNSFVGENETNITAGIEQSVSALPQVPEIYLFTDGCETVGNAELAAAAERSITNSGKKTAIYPVIIVSPLLSDCAILNIVAPQEVKVAEVFPVEVAIETNTPGKFRISVRGDHSYVEQKLIEIPATHTGVKYNIRFDVKAHEEGAIILSAELFPFDFADNYETNNSFSTAVRVSGKNNVLLVSSAGASSHFMAYFGLVESAKVAVVEPRWFPETLSSLLGVDVIILDNVSMSQLRQTQIEIVEKYVENGGGLFVSGGENSFGVGGYSGTILEKVLPVWTDPEIRRDLSLVLILDASGSMGETTKFLGEETTKFLVAARAAAAVVGELKPRDKVEIITFNVQPSVDFPLSDVGTDKDIRSVITEKLAKIAPSGGTNIYNALQKALEKLSQENQEVRILHILLLSDGKSLQGVFNLPAFKNKEISVSVVATGDSVDREQMKSVSEPTGGSYYEVSKFDSSLQEVFFKDFRRIPNFLIKEKEVKINKAASSPITEGISQIPELNKICITSPKKEVDVLLQTESGEPVIAAWQYGLGRCVAFTSSLNKGWGDKWRTWDKTGLLLLKIVTWCLRTKQDRDFTVSFTNSRENNNITLARVEAIDKQKKEYLNELKLKLHVSTPSGRTEELPMSQSAPGEYTEEISSREKGLFIVSVLRKSNGKYITVTQSQFYKQSSLEMMNHNINLPLLSGIASVSGGKTLSESEFLRRELPVISEKSGKSNWWCFALLAGLFYLADIVVSVLRTRKIRENK